MLLLVSRLSPAPHSCQCSMLHILLAHNPHKWACQAWGQSKLALGLAAAAVETAVVAAGALVG